MVVEYRPVRHRMAFLEWGDAGPDMAMFNETLEGFNLKAKHFVDAEGVSLIVIYPADQKAPTERQA